MATQPKTFITPEEYLERERAAPTKSQYHQGEVFAMAGASARHNFIILNLGSELKRQLRGGDCLVYITDMRLLVNASGLYTYPDVMVASGKRLMLDQQKDTLTNPSLIIEVLSPSTADRPSYSAAGWKLVNSGGRTGIRNHKTQFPCN